MTKTEMMSSFGRDLLRCPNVTDKDTKAHRSEGTCLMSQNELMVEFGQGCE